MNNNFDFIEYVKSLNISPIDQEIEITSGQQLLFLHDENSTPNTTTYFYNNIVIDQKKINGNKFHMVIDKFSRLFSGFIFPKQTKRFNLYHNGKVIMKHVFKDNHNKIFHFEYPIVHHPFSLWSILLIFKDAKPETLEDTIINEFKLRLRNLNLDLPSDINNKFNKLVLDKNITLDVKDNVFKIVYIDSNVVNFHNIPIENNYSYKTNGLEITLDNNNFTIQNTITSSIGDKLKIYPIIDHSKFIHIHIPCVQQYCVIKKIKFNKSIHPCDIESIAIFDKDIKINDLGELILPFSKNNSNFQFTNYNIPFSAWNIMILPKEGINIPSLIIDYDTYENDDSYIENLNIILSNNLNEIGLRIEEGAIGTI
jgi:hypothetical protein